MTAKTPEVCGGLRAIFIPDVHMLPSKVERRDDGTPVVFYLDRYYEMEVCGAPSYKPDVDARFGVHLCRQCFYAATREWARLNREAGLCRCGMETLPDQTRCRRCADYANRKQKEAYNRKRAAKKQAAERAEAKAKHKAEVAAYKEWLAGVDDKAIEDALVNSDLSWPDAAKALTWRRKPGPYYLYSGGEYLSQRQSFSYFTKTKRGKAIVERAKERLWAF